MLFAALLLSSASALAQGAAASSTASSTPSSTPPLATQADLDAIEAGLEAANATLAAIVTPTP